jgi:hypothetical protein
MDERRPIIPPTNAMKGIIQSVMTDFLRQMVIMIERSRRMLQAHQFPLEMRFENIMEDAVEPGGKG